ncbi:MAG: sulfotransferase [Rhizobiaceae bacterium]
MLYGDSFREIAIEAPVFISSLPRAGTTLFLELLSRLPGFASHRYRDMPFILAPILWRRMSERFRKSASLKERAHGDAMMVGYDSPEAFEEVVWRFYWSEKYLPDRICLWDATDTAEEFDEALKSHMQRIIAARAPTRTEIQRYVSKNNANISRIGYLKELFPDCIILVPFRHPTEHAASLLSQHQNFLARHEADEFEQRYMEDIGHLEFGKLHRPIEFAGADKMHQFASSELDYWLAYWIAAFGHVLSEPTKVALVSYDRACQDSAGAAAAIREALDLKEIDGAHELATMFKAPPPKRDLSDLKDKVQLEAALALHERLLKHSIN